MKEKGCLVWTLGVIGIYLLICVIPYIFKFLFYPWSKMESCTFWGSFLGIVILIISSVVSGRFISVFITVPIWAWIACVIGNWKAHACLGFFHSTFLLGMFLIGFFIWYAPQVFIFGLICGAGNSSEMGKFVLLDAIGYSVMMIGIWMCC